MLIVPPPLFELRLRIREWTANALRRKRPLVFSMAIFLAMAGVTLCLAVWRS